MDQFEVIFMVAKILFIVVVMLQVPPIMIWVERRGSALMQNRLGPNRIGPFGLLQTLVDAIKLIFKEDIVPGHVRKFYYTLAPAISTIPAFMTFAVIPFASSIKVGDHLISFQIANLNVGILYIFAIASLGVHGIIMAGWSSNNKYSILGSLRSSAQMVSYEISMALSVIGIVMCFSSIELNEIVRMQGETLLTIGGIAIPKYGFLIQPLGFLLLITALYAETNRLPFDLPEGESEIVAGYHLEYGSMKFSLFMLAEYINMFVASALITTLFFGGWQPLPGLLEMANKGAEILGLSGIALEWVRIAIEMGSFFIKVSFFLWLFVWVRWTIPRFRFDQVMTLGWKVMLPLALINIFVTGILIAMGVL